MKPFPLSRFTEAFTSLNIREIPDFSCWSFRDGMKFGNIDNWWEEEDNLRPGPHEGLDFATFLDTSVQLQFLSPGAMVPPIFMGHVLNIIDDFLGQTIIMGHEYKFDPDHSLRLLSFMAHLLPFPEVRPGSKIAAFDALGEIAPGNNKCRPHLHISTAWASPSFSAADFLWADFQENEGLLPCDPLQFIDMEG